MEQNPALGQIRAKRQISLLSRLIPGDIVSGTVLYTDENAVWVDIGGVAPACLPAERIALSPGFMPTGRFSPGQNLHAAVLSVHRDSKTIYLTHYELLGTFAENTANLRLGTVTVGRWLSPQTIELAPNLWGSLVGKATPSLYGKGKTIEVEIAALDHKTASLTLKPLARTDANLPPIHYFQTEGRLKRWAYADRVAAHPDTESVFFISLRQTKRF